jgi:biopolymer transport protein ExbB
LITAYQGGVERVAFLMEISYLFQKGGLVMYPLLGCSVIVVAIAIERFGLYRKAEADLPVLFAGLRPTLVQRDWSAAARLCSMTPGVPAAVLAAGLEQVNEGYGTVENLESVAALEAANLRKNLGYLDTIVTLAPLLGLLGTVIGMISSFSVLNIKTGNPSSITGGVGEALVATATGLCVAVLALIVHSYFSHRLDAIVTDMERACAFLLKYTAGEHR